MAKLSMVLAALAVLLFVVDASIYRTTVTIDEENPQQQSCREQFQRQENLRECQEYMRQESRGRREPVNQQEHLRRCCQRLEDVESRCRCDVLKMALEQQQQRGQMEREEMQEAMQVARNIPSMCQLSPGRCDFRSAWWF